MVREGVPTPPAGMRPCVNHQREFSGGRRESSGRWGSLHGEFHDAVPCFGRGIEFEVLCALQM